MTELESVLATLIAKGYSLEEVKTMWVMALKELVMGDILEEHLLEFVSKEEHRDLLEARNLLEHLRACGVYNWEGYERAKLLMEGEE